MHLRASITLHAVRSASYEEWRDHASSRNRNSRQLNFPHPCSSHFQDLDGSGKSTLVDYLKESLERDNRKVAVSHMNYDMGLYSVIRSLGSKAGRGLRGDLKSDLRQTHAPSERPHEGEFRSKAAKLRYKLVWNKGLRFLIYPIDVLIFLVYRFYVEKLNQQVLIMDRYFYDTLVDVTGARRSLRLRFLSWLTPTPNLPVYLDVSAEEAFARKNEYSVDYLNTRRLSYQLLISGLPDVLVLSTSQDLNATRLRVTRCCAGKDGGALMVEQERLYASIILRLLLDGAMKPDEKKTVSWGDLLHIAAQNGVLIRVVDQLETIGLEPRHFFSAAVREMRARNQRKLALIARIGRQCVGARVEFIFPKVVQSYPDMTGDIDLYIAARSLDADRNILKGFQAAPLKRTLRNRIEGTANYRLPGCDSVLEIHHGRVGMLGEHKLYISQLIENSRYVLAEGEEFLIPSPEDQLILQALQRVVQRSYLRLSDVVSTINILRQNRLNWSYILKTVNSLNTVYGLSCYLSFVDQIYRETFGDSVLPRDLTKSLVSKPGMIEFRKGFYRFRRFTVGSRGYVDKFCSAVLAENWSVASRLSLLPVLALTTVVRKLRTS